MVCWTCRVHRNTQVLLLKWKAWRGHIKDSAMTKISISVFFLGFPYMEKRLFSEFEGERQCKLPAPKLWPMQLSRVKPLLGWFLSRPAGNLAMLRALWGWPAVLLPYRKYKAIEMQNMVPSFSARALMEHKFWTLVQCDYAKLSLESEPWK